MRKLYKTNYFNLGIHYSKNPCTKCERKELNNILLSMLVLCILLPAKNVQAALHENVWAGAGVGLWLEIPFIFFSWHLPVGSVSVHAKVDIPWWLPDFHLQGNKSIVPGVNYAKAGIWIGDPPPFNLDIEPFDRGMDGTIDLVGYGDPDEGNTTDTIITSYLWNAGLVEIARDTNDDMIGDIMLYQGSLTGFDPSNFGLEELFVVHAPANVPVPPALWLFGSALLGLAGVKRRK
ncbi:MAG: hypothetical protein V3T17_10615 [Pseudomonadales bacterium]